MKCKNCPHRVSLAHGAFRCAACRPFATLPVQNAEGAAPEWCPRVTKKFFVSIPE
jgi:hypothetical protein